MSLLAHNWLVERIAARHISDAIAKWSSGHTLDIGCGSMRYAHLFDKYTGVEIDQERYCNTPPRVFGSALDLPIANGCVETVFSTQVLEHVNEPWRMIEEMARVLRPKGYLILSAPHIWGLHEEPSDYYRFTSYGLGYLVERAGLEVIEVIPMAGYWVTAGSRFCYYLRRFQRVLGPLIKPLYALVQLLVWGLDTIHRVETDAWNYLIVARRPGNSS